MLDLINDVVDVLARGHDDLTSADRPSGRSLPRSMSRILIGPEASVTIGMHSKPASHSDYQRGTVLLGTRQIKPIWLVNGEDPKEGDHAQAANPRPWYGTISETEATLTDGHQLCELDDLLLGTAVGEPKLITIEDTEPEAEIQPPPVLDRPVVIPMVPAAWALDDPMPDYDASTFIDSETEEPLEHPWCPVCAQPRSRAERSTHVIREVLAEPEGVVIDAGLLTEIDDELGTEVFTGEAGTRAGMETALSRFVEYGWGSTDRDGDILRTDVTASEPIDAELREQAREMTRRTMAKAGLAP